MLQWGIHCVLCVYRTAPARTQTDYHHRTKDVTVMSERDQTLYFNANYPGPIEFFARETETNEITAFIVDK
jgi:hypothetical protein